MDNKITGDYISSTVQEHSGISSLFIRQAWINFVVRTENGTQHISMQLDTEQARGIINQLAKQFRLEGASHENI